MAEALLLSDDATCGDHLSLSTCSGASDTRFAVHTAPRTCNCAPIKGLTPRHVTCHATAISPLLTVSHPGSRACARKVVEGPLEAPVGNHRSRTRSASTRLTAASLLLLLIVNILVRRVEIAARQCEHGALHSLGHGFTRGELWMRTRKIHSKSIDAVLGRCRSADTLVDLFSCAY